jgi:hypothetical protein
MIFLMCCWILFASILLRIFASMFIKDICLWFSFSVVSLLGFGMRVMQTHHRMGLVMFLPFLILEKFEEYWY